MNDSLIQILKAMGAPFPSFGGIPMGSIGLGAGLPGGLTGGLSAIAGMMLSGNSGHPAAVEFAKLFEKETAAFWERVTSQTVPRAVVEEVEEPEEEAEQPEADAPQVPRIKTEPVDPDDDVFPMAPFQARNPAVTREKRAIRKAEEELELLKLVWQRQQTEQEVEEWRKKTADPEVTGNRQRPGRRPNQRNSTAAPANRRRREAATRPPRAAGRQTPAQGSGRPGRRARGQGTAGGQ